MLRLQGSAATVAGAVGQADARRPCVCVPTVNVHVSDEPGAHLISRPNQVHISCISAHLALQRACGVDGCGALQEIELVVRPREAAADLARGGDRGECGE